jgi:O-antigen/teichoic acid export membrane protein
MLHKTLRNFVSQMLSLVVSFGDRFVLAAILLRAWPTDLYADWVTIQACTGLMGLADFGFVVFIGNRLQKAFNVKDEPGFQRLIGFSAFAYVIMALLMLMILVGLAVWELAHPFLTTRILAPPETATVLLLLGLVQILHSAKSSVTQLYRGRGNFARGNFIDSVAALGIFLSAILAAVCGASATILALVYIGAHLVFGWGILLNDIRRRYGAIRLGPLWPSGSDIRDAALAMRWYSLGFALPLIWLQAPLLILSMLGLGSAAVVTFVIHRTLVNFCRTFTVMLATSAGVELTSHVHAGNTSEIKRGVAIIGHIVGAIGGVMVGGLLTFGGPLIQTWTGLSDLLDTTTLLWLTVPAITVAPAVPLLYLAQLADLPKPLALSQVAQAVLAIVIALLLVRQYGASGVALALAVSETLAIGILLPVVVGRCLGINFWRHSLRCLSVALAALVWAGGVAQAIAHSMDIIHASALMLAGLLWACVTLPAVVYLLAPAPQRKWMVHSIYQIGDALRRKLNVLIIGRPKPSC